MSHPSTAVFAPGRAVHGRSGFSPLVRITSALAVAAVLLVAPPLTLGARLELLVDPVLRNQAVPADNVVRSGDRLCWTWMRDKERAPEVLDINVVLTTPGGDRSYPEVFDETTGVPWHRGGALPPGHYESRFCVQWPKFAAADERVLIRSTVRYRGLLGLWDLTVPLPDVASP